MDYDRQILFILNEVGAQGIGVRQLAKHVYNMNCTLFVQPDLLEIHRYVQRYLLRHSKTKGSLISRTDRRGRYRLNTQHSAEARQVVISFKQEKAARSATTGDTTATESQPDLSLSLFG